MIWFLTKMKYTNPIQDLNVPLPLKPHTFKYITKIILYSIITNITPSIPIAPTNTDSCLSSEDRNFTIFIVSHYDCENQHNLRKINLLHVKQCAEAHSILQHANVPARVDVRAKAEQVKTCVKAQLL